MSKKNPKNYGIKNIDFGSGVTLLIENFKDNQVKSFIDSIVNNTCSSYVKYDLKKSKTIVNKKTVLPILSNELKVANDDNLYFIFDDLAKMRYVGIKDDNTINQRLKDHLLETNLNSTYSTRMKDVIRFIEVDGKDTLYVLTTKVSPEYMNKSVEKYFLEYFWSKCQADWNKTG